MSSRALRESTTQAVCVEVASEWSEKDRRCSLSGHARILVLYMPSVSSVCVCRSLFCGQEGVLGGALPTPSAALVLLASRERDAPGVQLLARTKALRRARESSAFSARKVRRSASW